MRSILGRSRRPPIHACFWILWAPSMPVASGDAEKLQRVVTGDHLLLRSGEAARGERRLYPLRLLHRERPVRAQQYVVSTEEIDGAAHHHGMQPSGVAIGA